MRLLFKALVAKHKKTVLILILSMFIVFTSLHVASSFSSQDVIITEQLKQAGAFHTLITPKYHDQAVGIMGLESIQEFSDTITDIVKKYDGEIVESYYEEFKHSLYGYDISPSELGLELEDAELTFQVTTLNEELKNTYVTYEGKSIDDLTGNEISISRGLAAEIRRLGYDPIGYVIQRPVDFEASGGRWVPIFDDNENYEIVSVFDTVRSQLVNTEAEQLDSVPFFQSFETSNIAFVNQEYFLQKQEAKLKVAQESGDEYQFNQLTTLMNAPKFNVRFDNYSRNNERAMSTELNEVMGYYFRCEYCRREKIKLVSVDSMDAFLMMSPVVDELMKVVSSYIIVGVLISCFYAFYIHFRNQIRKSYETIGALLIGGVDFKRIILMYFAELFIVFIFGLVLYLSSVPLMASLSSLYSNSLIAISQSIKYSLLFISLVMILVVLILNSFKTKGFHRIKVGARISIRKFKLTQKTLLSTIAIKRVVTYVRSSLGYVLSIAIVVMMLILASVASFQIKNVYHKDTFGIQFDYMVMDATEDIFFGTQEFSNEYAVIGKRLGVNYSSHDFDIYNFDFYKSSIIDFYNTIDAFVPVFLGEYPPDIKDNINSESARRSEGSLVSRRHMNKRQLSIYDDIKVSDPVESAYLFYELPGALYERATKVYGTMNTLFNNGWNVYNYSFIDELSYLKEKNIEQYILNLKNPEDAPKLEQYLNENNVDFIRYDTLMDSFQDINNEMNEVSLVILTSVLILMGLLLMITLSGLISSVKSEHEKDDVLLARLGFKKNNSQKINVILGLIRLLLTLVVIILATLIIYPFYINDILDAFALYSLPVQIFSTMIGVIISVFVISVLIYFKVYRYKDHE